MGKRFGRNQKRRMRAELEAARAEAKLAMDRMKINKAVTKDACEAFDKLLALLNHHNAYLPPQLVHLARASEARHYREAANHEIPDFPSFEVTPSECPIVYEVLEFALIDGTISYDRLTDSRHVLFWVNDERIGYGLTRQAVRDIPPKALARMIAEQLTGHCLELLRKSL